MKRFLVKLRRFVRNNEDGVVHFFIWCTVVAGIALGTLLLGTTVNSCSNRPATTADYAKQYVDSIDITYIDANTILPHDTKKFKTAQEEYDFLVEANRFKRKLADEALEAIEIVESIMEDGLDGDIKYSVDELYEALETNGYYEHVTKIDSLLNTQL